MQEIREIIKLVDASSLDEFVYEADGTKVKLKRSNGVVTQVVAPKVEAQTVVQQPVVAEPAKASVETTAAPQPVAPKVEVAGTENLHKITSPMVGTFYQSPNPESPAFVKVGDEVGEETIVCIVEAMKLFNEIEAEVEGEIVEVLVKDGQLVEYGQPLFLVKVK